MTIRLLPLAALWTALPTTACDNRGAVAPASPLHVAEFDDGARMEILGVGNAELTFQRGTERKRWWRPGGGNSSSSSYAHGHFNNSTRFGTQYRKENGTESWTASQGEMRPLMLAIDLSGADGGPWQIARSFSRPFLHEDDRLMEKSNWFAPKGALDPGSRIRIALAPPLERDRHVFPIEVGADGD